MGLSSRASSGGSPPEGSQNKHKTWRPRWRKYGSLLLLCTPVIIQHIGQAVRGEEVLWYFYLFVINSLRIYKYLWQVQTRREVARRAPKTLNQNGKSYPCIYVLLGYPLLFSCVRMKWIECKNSYRFLSIQQKSRWSVIEMWFSSVSYTHLTLPTKRIV